ncbi:hypothetical protein VBR58_000813 [Citrobacter freundii]|nr:hypothetical protein [Citrobacter freundii]ELJ9990417.1 hypothetical protein [Citrobacter freundii]EMC0438028.1 hypothetical protein [Citrobacter freundii]EMD0452286.1 hypothetical protein [Citrobacter freundii]
METFRVMLPKREQTIVELLENGYVHISQYDSSSDEDAVVSIHVDDLPQLIELLQNAVDESNVPV